MDASSWLWIAIAAFVIFCCLAMLLMRGHGPHSGGHKHGAGDVRPAAGDDVNGRSEGDSGEPR